MLQHLKPDENNNGEGSAIRLIGKKTDHGVNGNYPFRATSPYRPGARQGTLVRKNYSSMHYKMKIAGILKLQ